MELQKGSVYQVKGDYDHMLHDRAEYHSTSSRAGDGRLLHNMIIRMTNDDLEMALFFDEGIIAESEGDV